jgi:hypothetical protein
MRLVKQPKHRKPRSVNQGEGTKSGRQGKRGAYDFGAPMLFVHTKMPGGK